MNIKKFIYKLFKIKRYFIVLYKFSTIDGRQFDGRISIISTDGSYVSSTQFLKIVKCKIIYTEIDLGKLIILNITELSKSDYNDFLN